MQFQFLVRRQKEDMQVNVAGIRRNIKNLAHNYSDPQVCQPRFKRLQLDLYNSFKMHLIRVYLCA